MMINIITINFYIYMLILYHPGLAEINAPVGPQEVMPLLKETIAQCRLGQPISSRRLHRSWARENGQELLVAQWVH